MRSFRATSPGFHLSVRRALVVVVCTAMLAAACSSGGSSPKPTSSAAAEGAFSAKDVDATIAQLAAAGIAVFDKPGAKPEVKPVAPVSPVRLSKWQATNLAHEAWAGNGTVGADLDALERGRPKGAPTVSQWLAAYVSGAKTPGGDFARELMGSQDLHRSAQILFPQLVLTLYASDVGVRLLKDPVPGESSGAIAPVGPPGGATVIPAVAAGPRMADGGPCGAFSNLINEVVSDVLKAVQIPPPRVGDTGSTLLNQILQAGANLTVGFLNWAIGGVIKIAVGAVKVALKAVLDPIAKAAGLVAVVSQVVSALRPWAVKIKPEQDTVHRSVDDKIVYDKVTAVVDMGGLKEWPTELQACAKLLDVTLPELRPIGTPVKWVVAAVPNGVATDFRHDETLKADPAGAAADLTLRTGAETAEEHAKGAEGSGLVNVSVTIQRKEFTELKESILALAIKFLGQLPPLINTIAQKLLNYPIQALLEELISLMDEHGAGYVTVSYHGPAKPPPPAAPGPLSGTWAGTLTSYRGDVAAFTVDLQQNGSAFVGQLHVPTANCNKEAKVTGTLSGGKVDFGVSQGADLTGNFTGTVSGTTMSGTWSGPAGGICGSDHGTWTGKKVS
jgi:hypothetical protein